jgi:hypothetical protein
VKSLREGGRVVLERAEDGCVDARDRKRCHTTTRIRGNVSEARCLVEQS